MVFCFLSLGEDSVVIYLYIVICLLYYLLLIPQICCVEIIELFYLWLFCSGL